MRMLCNQDKSIHTGTGEMCTVQTNILQNLNAYATKMPRAKGKVTL